jgi:hypothetical protein
MMKFLPSLLILLIPFTLSSCFKKDSEIPRHPRGNVQTDTIPLTQNYRYQVYFDLQSGTIVSTNAKTDCDLGFECSADGWHVILNTADFMKVADLGVQPFGQAQDTANRVWKFDKSDGNTDSIAIGRWFTVAGKDTVSNGHVYALNRGMDENGNELGVWQAIFDSLAEGVYYFRIAPIKGGNVIQAAVPKDPTVHYLYYSFSNGGVIKHLEPPSDSYDLLFTQYTTLLYTDAGQAYPYIVTGVLLNRGIVNAVLDTVHNFSDIDLAIAQNTTLSATLDAIGYEWKTYNFDAGTYTVNPADKYIIRDKTGLYFKLRFIGFIDAQGNKGYPVIEYQGL